MSAADLAARMLELWDLGGNVDRTALALPTTLPEAEALQDRLTALRVARGERPLGYKIGFTNRTLWPLYGVHHPIWGPLWDTRFTQLEGTDARASLAGFAEPRLEPEIVVGLARTPESDDPQAVFDSLAWVAHGYEIVQSPFSGWRFNAAESVAAQGLHGALIVGPRKSRSHFAGWQALASFSIELFLDDRLAASGDGTQVLDGPVQALAHLVRELAARGRALPPDAIVTTGTLTDAQPLRPGQRWRTRLHGIDLPGLTLAVAA